MDDKIIISTVPCGMINFIWDKVSPFINMVEEKSPEDIVEKVVKEQLSRGNQVLVIIYRNHDIIAINVLEIRTLDSDVKVLYIPITAGAEMELWLDDFLKIAIKIAKDQNCIELRGLAVRNGWLRKLKPYGWDELFTTIRYKIGE